MARFGTDQQCRDYLFAARWPEGFRCLACGHADAYALKTKIVDECVACGKQHSLLAGTIFEQTKTGLARWFLAIYLVTSSKGGISAMELKRQMGFGRYQTARTAAPPARPGSPGRSRAAAVRRGDAAWAGSGWRWCPTPRPGASQASSA